MTRSNPSSLTPQEATAALHAHLLLPMDGLSMPDHLLAIDLIDAGADINAPDRNGLPPLLRCLSWSYSENDPDVFKTACHDMLDVLLARGADLNALTPQGQSHADLATQWSDNQLASKKLGREAYRRSEPALAAAIGKIDTSWPKPGEPASAAIKSRFVGACSNGLLDEITYMLHIYPDAVHWQADQKDHKNCTGLIAGVCSGKHRQDITRLFIAKGANVNQRNGINRTALHYAALVDDVCVTLLMQAGADETLYDTQDRTPYELAQARASSDDRCLRAMDGVIAERNNVNDNISARQAAQWRSSAIITQQRRDGAKFKLPSP